MAWLVAALAAVVAVAAVAWARIQVRAVPPPAPPPPPPPPAPTLGDRAAMAALMHVADQANRVARGDPPTPPTDAHLPPAAVTALEALRRVGTRLDEMTNARAHIVATERDLDRARAMYRSILPLDNVGQHGRIHLAGTSMPAAETGGDWWTYRKLSGGRLLVAVGDATGHGVYSAMIGCAAHGAVEALSHVGEEQMTPRAVLTAIKAAIRIPGADRAAMTCFAALFDPAGAVSFANASHMLPLLATTDDSGAVTKVAALSGGAGRDELDDSDVYTGDLVEGRHQLAPGEVVVLLTDGLTDRRDKNGRAYGHRRLQQALMRLTVGRGEDSVIALRDGLLADVALFAAGEPADDDVTLVLCAFERD